MTTTATTTPTTTGIYGKLQCFDVQGVFYIGVAQQDSCGQQTTTLEGILQDCVGGSASFGCDAGYTDDAGAAFTAISSAGTSLPCFAAEINAVSSLFTRGTLSTAVTCVGLTTLGTNGEDGCAAAVPSLNRMIDSYLPDQNGADNPFSDCHISTPTTTATSSLTTTQTTTTTPTTTATVTGAGGQLECVDYNGVIYIALSSGSTRTFQADTLAALMNVCSGGDQVYDLAPAEIDGGIFGLRVAGGSVLAVEDTISAMLARYLPSTDVLQWRLVGEQGSGYIKAPTFAR